MGSPSVSTHRGLVHWQGLLLVVSLATSWSQHITYLVSVVSPSVVEGTQATLHILHKPLNAAGFQWYRGEDLDSSNIIAYLSVKSGTYERGSLDGQATVQDDGSLVLQNVTVEDSGIYTVVVRLPVCKKMVACGHLTVFRVIDVPTLQASKTTVREHKDAVVLTCDANYGAIKWLFNGKTLPLTDRMQLSLDHRNLTINPVLSSDDGYYQCKAYNPLTSGTSAPLKLGVSLE